MGPDWAPCGLAHPAGGTAVSSITECKNVFLFLGIKGHSIFFFNEFLQLKSKQMSYHFDIDTATGVGTALLVGVMCIGGCSPTSNRDSQ